MATPTFSGFLSNLNMVSSIPNNDIMSTIAINYPMCDGNNSTYSAGYMYIGELLIQFTTGNTNTTVPTTYGAGGNITIQFPIHFNGAPYCVLANPFSISGSPSNYTVTVTSMSLNEFEVVTGGHDSYVVYIAIGRKLL